MDHGEEARAQEPFDQLAAEGKPVRFTYLVPEKIDVESYTRELHVQRTHQAA